MISNDFVGYSAQHPQPVSFFWYLFSIIQQLFAKGVPIQDQSCCKPNHQCGSHALKGIFSLCARGCSQFLALSLSVSLFFSLSLSLFLSPSLRSLCYFLPSWAIGMLDTDWDLEVHSIKIWSCLIRSLSSSISNSEASMESRWAVSTHSIFCLLSVP